MGKYRPRGVQKAPLELSERGTAVGTGLVFESPLCYLKCSVFVAGSLTLPGPISLVWKMAVWRGCCENAVRDYAEVLCKPQRTQDASSLPSLDLLGTNIAPAP